MGGGGRNREQQNYWNQQAQQQNQQITQVDPLEAQWRQQQMDYLNWRNSPGRDVRDAPGLSDYIQIGQAAQERAQRDRQGTGALQLGGAGNAGYTENLKSLRQNEAAQDFGTGLERALAMRHSEASGSVMPLAQLTTNRNVARANHSAGMFNTWSQRRSMNWWDYLREGTQIASNIGGMLFGGGM